MILVTGASGAIGGRLVTRLLDDDLPLVAAGRRPEELADRWPGIATARIDVLDDETLPSALEGISVAYYLVHSMEPGVDSFEETDRIGASNFARAAAKAGVERLVYLGGLGEQSEDLSSHLASRQEVGRVLAEEGPPTLELRAAMVVSAESASFRMLRDLVNRLPAMIVPRWVDTPSQPIAVDDVIDYLVAGASVQLPEHHTVVQIGGPERVTYREMLHAYAGARGTSRPILGVPFLTPRLSSLWCGLTTSVPAELARPLIDGLSTEVVVRDDSARRLFPDIDPMPFSEALDRVLAEEHSS